MDTLETERLTLREMRRSDVDGLYLLFSDPLLMRFWLPFDWSGTEQWVERNLRRYEQDGFGLWTLVLKSSGEVIGDCGMITQEIEGAKATEIGWHVRRDLWRQGLTTEAARAGRDYGFDRLGVDGLCSLIHPENVASQRVAEKIGMMLAKQVQHKGKLRCLYTLERPRR